MQVVIYHSGFFLCTDIILLKGVVFILSKKEKLKTRHHKKCVVRIFSNFLGKKNDYIDKDTIPLSVKVV